MIVAFLEPKHRYDLSADIPASYKQLKSYLLTYSENRDSLSMRYCDEVQHIPQDVDVVGVSGLTQNFTEVIALGAAIREAFPDCLLILGGHHISFLPESLPVQYDLGVMFEGETTFHEIIDTYISSHRDRKTFHDMKGIVLHGPGGKVRINPPNPIIEPLDRIPYPVIEGGSPPYVFSSRGCPYKCDFCASTTFWKKARFFSADYVLSQIEHIQQHSPQKTVVFWDDLVIADKDRFINIVEGIEARGINENTSFGFAVRANLIDEEICRLLVRLNTSFVSFGAESGSDRILQLLKGKSVSVQTNQRALDLLSEYGIFSTCSFILGSPTETGQDVRQTFTFIRRNLAGGKLYRPAINLLMPLPGTGTWAHAINNGIIAPPFDWNRFRFFASYKDSHIDDIDEWIKKRLECNSYYLNDEYIPHEELLDMLADFEHEVSELEQDQSVTRKKEAEMQERLNEYDKCLRLQNARLEESQASIAEYDERLRRQHSRVQQLEASLDEYSKLLAANREQVSEMTANVQAAHAALERRDHELTEQKSQLHRQETTIAGLRIRLESLAPLVSVIVICWNNRRFLKRCFDALMQTTYPKLEIFLADNASTDGSAAFVAEHYPSVRIIVHPTNLGFAEGNNRVMRLAKGKYIITLNPDTEVDPDWIRPLVEVAERDDSVGMLSPKMYLMDQGRRLNSAGGDMLLRSGDNLARGFYLEDDGRFDRIEETFGPSAGAGFYRRTMLDDIGLFDKGLFTYYEDVDLNIRAQLRGYRCLYVPNSVVYHYQAGTLDDHSPFKAFLLQRNKWYVVLKDFPVRLIWHCRRDLARSYINAMRHLRAVVHRRLPYKIHLSLLKRLPRILVSRCAGALRRRPGTAQRIEQWVDRHEDTYRQLDQAAAVARYFEDLRKRNHANPAS